MSGFSCNREYRALRRQGILLGWRKEIKIYLIDNGNIAEIYGVLFDITKYTELEIEKSHAHESLHKAFKEIKILRDIIAICSLYKQIRDDKGFWHQIDTYLRDYTEADFSHASCTKCYER
jgi:hypothetical protein